MKVKDWHLLLVGILAGLLGLLVVLQLFRNGSVVQHKAAILYLSPPAAPEIWRVETDGSGARQLTASDGKIYDYAVWADGSRIVYSAENSLGGLDLWILDRDGGGGQRLFDCGSDRCFQPTVSPDGLKIAYSRRNQAENPGGSAGLPRIWLYLLQSGETQPLYANALVVGSMPAWSPDGRMLTFYNPRSAAIQVYQSSAEKDIQIPTELEGSGGFLPDSQGLIYANYLQAEERPVGILSRFDLKSGRTQPVFEELGLVDYGTPAVNASGEWLAVAGQLQGEVSARHIWVTRLDGKESLRISDDAQLTQSAYHWDAAGKRIVYQQFKLGSSGQVPELYLWDLETRSSSLIIRNAFLPDWLP
jgi:Tol biopolymer transport system component